MFLSITILIKSIIFALVFGSFQSHLYGIENHKKVNFR